MPSLVILVQQRKIHDNPSIVDNILIAEIPEMEEGSQRQQLVKKHMLHGPGGNLNVNSLNMYKDKYDHHVCKKLFHRDYLAETLFFWQPCIQKCQDINRLQEHVYKIS
jgi:hypothetical protein